ncbi:hypothetical protein FC50_GL000501 [Lacticaseibacillus pantheris DSM 15945 = JCM 12539 = NBRC 106106]|uniref:Integral membrane protein n=3 Tax=Lacticaseibacillus pantheris TaxID=171523 RepID=A0A0R1U6Z8_9LACO|nr:hypothetical protein FC50_GL000501 [Lacticaseibacillus pantheris DSM 15945 = JCM 12539 = NBRC 106106]
MLLVKRGELGHCHTLWGGKYPNAITANGEVPMRWINSIKRHPLTVAFALPIIIMGIYFCACQHVYPFGNSSLLTVDMGQQYIDFYAYFRQTLLGHPGQFFYAWNKALGGDMIGVWAYYLMSPFNLVLVLVPKSMLDVGILIMTLLKYGAASLSMAYYLHRRGLRSWVLPAYGLAYALSGWMIANQLNLMWFDGAIMLPLVADAVDRLVAGQPRRFPLLLAATLLVNYYIGYMVILFTIGYFLFALVRDRLHKAAVIRACRRFALTGLLGAALAACLLVPTFFQITQSKGTYTATTVNWQFEYNPLHLLSKLVAGSFNFDQMPSGLPNIFVGSLATLGAIIYFTNRRINWRERVAAGTWTVFLFISMMFEPLDLVWHGLQFPVWYPYRFSFVVTFWLILLAARGFKYLPDGISLPQMLLLAFVCVGADLYVWFNLDSFSYLTKQQVLLTGLLNLLAIIVLSLRGNAHRGTYVIMLLLSIVDMTSNAALTMNQLAYVSHSDYHTYTEALRSGVNTVQSRDSGWYRIGKTVGRTKNDAMEVGFNGTDQFNSMFEPNVPTFFGQIGQADGDGFVAYANGTEFTDALLDTKYWLTKRAGSTAFLPTESTREDVANYTGIGHTQNLNVYRNDNALGIAFGASANILQTKLATGSPLTNQERIATGLTGAKTTMFTARPFESITMTNNIKSMAGIGGSTYTVKKGGAATITYTFIANTTEPYYLTVDSSLTDNAATVRLNGQQVHLADSFRNTAVLNVTPAQVNKVNTITITLNKQSLFLGNVALYQLDTSGFKQTIDQLQKSPLHVTHHGSNSLRGTVNIRSKNQVLMTTIPQVPGWHVRVDGRTVTPKKVLGLFMAIPLTKGHHTISMYYVPPYLVWGIIISQIAAAITWFAFFRNRPRHAALPRFSKRLRQRP